MALRRNGWQWKRWAALALVALGGCGPRPTGPSWFGRVDGVWLTGPGTPPGGVVALECDQVDRWVITQSGSHLHAEFKPAGRGTPDVNWYAETAEGETQGAMIELRGMRDTGLPGYSSIDPGAIEPVVYQLQHDEPTGQLVGTRNGRPFWATRYVALKACGQRVP